MDNSGRSLDGRVALITGASRGIGQALAVRFAAEGAKVVLVGRDETTRRKDLSGTLEEGLARVNAVGGTAIALRADLGDVSYDKTNVVEQVVNTFGRSPDVMVHSAAAPREWGIDSHTAFSDTSAESFLRGVQVNVWGGWDLAKAVIPGMRSSGAGWILFVSSQQAAPRPNPVSNDTTRYANMGGACIYGGTKAFLDRVCTGAALELYQDNIAVNSLAPTGAIATPLSVSVGVPPEGTEPMETFVEAALALCSSDPRQLTSRIAHSLPLLHELNRPVYSLDGGRLFDGWQPEHDDERKFLHGYLAALDH